MNPDHASAKPVIPTSIDKALEVCETLSLAQSGLALTDVARAVGLPRPSVHRLLAVLKRRGYVRQDDESGKYSLTMKMLDLSFRLLGRSELRLHAVPASADVTYIWGAGPDEAAMRTAYGKRMPAHCADYFDDAQGTRRLSCLRLSAAADLASSPAVVIRLGSPDTDGGQRLFCTCAPVHDYSGREVARVGVFGHGPDDVPMLTEHNRDAWALGRRVSMRLGFLPAAAAETH
jgi:DNA-binding transcriptional ArsR family regulator